MPQLNTSDGVKARIASFLEKLLAYANHEIDYEHLRQKLIVRWAGESDSAPKLIVQTELRFLAELITTTASPKAKETLKHDLHVLKRFLEILDDNRTKTQGSAVWHFTLNLWHRSIEVNVRAFQQEWERRKSLKSSATTSVEPAGGNWATNPVRNPTTNAIQPTPPMDLMVPSGSAMVTTSSIQASIQADRGFAPPPDPIQLDTVQLDAFSLGFPINPPAISSELGWERSLLRPLTVAADGAMPSLRHNLPVCDYTQLVGRQQPLLRLLELLHPDSTASRIGIEGVGGIGKTSLVLAAAYRCLQASGDRTSPAIAPPFDAIIFTSAKSHHLTAHGLLPRFRREQSLRQIFRTIAQTLGYPDSSMPQFEQQLDYIQTLLARQRVLLIIDHLETIAEQQEVLSFLYEMPLTVKVVITSCERALVDTSIRLEPLGESDGLELIDHQAETKDIQLSPPDIQTLYQSTGGIPAAIVYALGQLAKGYPFQDMMARLTLAENDFCRFYFEPVVQSLRGEPAHQLLMALALFPQSAAKEAIAHIAQLDPIPTDGLAQLHQRSLLQIRDDRYALLPLLRHYLLAELSRHPDFEHQARDRWVNWYLSGLHTDHRDRCRDDLPALMGEAEWENLCAAIEWCRTQRRYQDCNRFQQLLRNWPLAGQADPEQWKELDWVTACLSTSRDARRIPNVL